MRLKALTLGIDLSKYSRVQEGDILGFLLKQHNIDLMNIMLTARNVGKPEDFGNLKFALRKLITPWEIESGVAAMSEDEKEFEEIYNKYRYEINPYNLLTGEPTLEITNKKDRKDDNTNKHK